MCYPALTSTTVILNVLLKFVILGLNIAEAIMSIYEEFKCKNRYIHFYPFEIFALKATEKQRK